MTFCVLSMLIPNGRSPFFGPFLEFGQAIVDAIFVQKISIFFVNMWFSLSFKTLIFTRF
jgi:hypothetical protein